MLAMRFLQGLLIAGLIVGTAGFPSTASPSAVPPPPEKKLIKKLAAGDDFNHAVGRKGSRGWDLDYRRDRPGYALKNLREPLMLEPGFYRATFILRRGHYPRKGILYQAYGLFRLEIWDATEKKMLTAREVQLADFSGPNKYEERWIEFSTRNIPRNAVEPRLFWLGLANGEVASVEIHRFPLPDPRDLLAKAQRLGEKTERDNLENGFIVSRKKSGEPDERGDGTTYTGFYLASLAWKYAVTKDELTYQAMENAVQTLHVAIKGTSERPLLARFVEADGTPFPNAPSKDVYTSFFFGYATAYPYISNQPLKNQMRADVQRLGGRFLDNNLQIKEGPVSMVALTPYLTEDEIRDGIRKLFKNKKHHRNFIKGLKAARRYISFGDLWPGMKDVINALTKQDEDALIRLVVPTANGVFRVLQRGRDILKEKYRNDLFPRRFSNQNFPGKRLTEILTESLRKVSDGKPNEPFQKITDLRFLGGNSLLALQIVRSAYAITKKQEFDQYYRTNLFANDALLKTCLDWYGVDEDLTMLTEGNPTADRERSGYLGLIALYALASTEKNPYFKDNYLALLRRAWKYESREDNPLTTAVYLSIAKDKTVDASVIERALALYPEDRLGFGEEYWDKHADEVAELVGGGREHGYAREALPVSHRPKDCFLWQRNPRRLKGDHLNQYPAIDYLFVYWFSRFHKILPAPPEEPLVQNP